MPIRPSRRSRPRVYVLEVLLSDVEPQVWRRIRMSSGATLARCVRVVAIALDWPPGRSYAFGRGPLRFEGRGPTTAGREGGEEPRLRQLLHDPGDAMDLEYGDRHPWHLTLRLLRILPPNEQLVTPWCEDGAGNAPPMDVGGPWAYEEWRTAGAESSEDAVVLPPAPGGADAGRATDLRGDQPAAFPTLRFNPAVVNAQFERLR